MKENLIFKQFIKQRDTYLWFVNVNKQYSSGANLRLCQGHNYVEH